MRQDGPQKLFVCDGGNKIPPSAGNRNLAVQPIASYFITDWDISTNNVLYTYGRIDHGVKSYLCIQ
jgi:hypothetical protein